MPLDYIFRVMRDPAVQQNAAMRWQKAAAPFLHSRLASIEQHGSADMPPVLTHIRVSFVKPDGTEVDDLDEAAKPRTVERRNRTPRSHSMVPKVKVEIKG